MTNVDRRVALVAGGNRGLAPQRARELVVQDIQMPWQFINEQQQRLGPAA
jgi:hypothetical protein